MDADEIHWTLPPVDKLTLDSDERWLVEALRSVSERLRSMVVTNRQYQARTIALVRELREAQTEIRRLRARVRALEGGDA
jgi:hypothetical protein